MAQPHTHIWRCIDKLLTLGAKDASGEKIRFDAWSIRLTSTLGACGVEGALVDADHPQSGLIKHVISLSVAPHLALTVTAATSAQAAYQALKDEYKRACRLQRPAVRLMITTARPLPGELIRVFTERVRRLMTQFNDGAEGADLMSETGVVETILPNLPSMYAMDVKLIQRAAGPITLDELAGQLMVTEINEQFVASSLNGPGAGAPVAGEFAMTAMGSRQECTYCGARGHVAATCFKQHDDKNRPVKRIDCDFCGLKGHVEADCVKRKAASAAAKAGGRTESAFLAYGRAEESRYITMMGALGNDGYDPRHY